MSSEDITSSEKVSSEEITLDDIRSLFSRAEDAIKRYERISLSVLTPAVNQLRYVSYHLLENSLPRAYQHCERAYYDALECSVSELLGFFARFYQAGYPESSILRYAQDFSEWRVQLKEYQRLLISTRRLKTLSEKEIDALDAAIVWLIDKQLVLRDVITKLDEEKITEDRERAELERQAKQIEAESENRRENRRYWHSMTIAYASVIVGIVSLIIALLAI